MDLANFWSVIDITSVADNLAHLGEDAVAGVVDEDEGLFSAAVIVVLGRVPQICKQRRKLLEVGVFNDRGIY